MSYENLGRDALVGIAEELAERNTQLFNECEQAKRTANDHAQIVTEARSKLSVLEAVHGRGENISAALYDLREALDGVTPSVETKYNWDASGFNPDEELKPAPDIMEKFARDKADAIDSILKEAMVFHGLTESDIKEAGRLEVWPDRHECYYNDDLLCVIYNHLPQIGSHPVLGSFVVDLNTKYHIEPRSLKVREKPQLGDFINGELIKSIDYDHFRNDDGVLVTHCHINGVRYKPLEHRIVRPYR